MASSFGIAASGMDAMSVAGQFHAAICCEDGVDIVNCDEKRHVQSLRDCPGALHTCWSLRTLHLAVILKDSIYIYSCCTSPAALTPMWVKTKTVYFSDVANVNELVSSVSFRYPHILALQNKEVRLVNCRSGSNISVDPAPDILSLAQLSYTGVIIAVCAAGTRRIDFLEVKGNSSLLISKREHSNEVCFLSWRPGYSSERELLLATDATNLVRIWAVDHRQGFDNAEGRRTAYAEAHLLIELGDFVGKPAIFSWLLHGLSTAAETSFLNEHFTKSSKEPVKPWKAGNSSSDIMSSSPSGVFSTGNHPSTSGSWLTVLDERGVLRLLCISPVGLTGHMQCILRGRGPALKDMPEVLPVCGVHALGRFQPNGADKPVALECIYVFRLNSFDNNTIGRSSSCMSDFNGVQRVAGSYAFGGLSKTATTYERAESIGSGQIRRGSTKRRGSGALSSTESGNLLQSRRLIRLISLFTTGPADDFVSVSQNEKEFIVSDFNPSSTMTAAVPNRTADSRKKAADFMLPSSSQSGWRLETWETYALGGAKDTGGIVPKSFRALSSPWAGTEAALWCYAHRHKSHQYHPEVVGSLASLHFQPIDVTAAGLGFEVTHDILRALWLAAPQQAPPSSEEIELISIARGDHRGSAKLPRSASKESGPPIDSSANVPILVTLQRKQLDCFVIAIWAVQHAPISGHGHHSKAADGPVFGGKIEEVGGNPAAMSDGSFVLGLKRNESKNKYNSEPSLNIGINASGVDFYEVSITPDPHFGLGLRLDVADGVVIVESFKRNPLTMKMMPAEESGIIGVGDELLSVNANELKGHSLSDVIQIIRIVVQNARGSAVVLKLRAVNKVRSSSGVNEEDIGINDDAAERLRFISTEIHARQTGWYRHDDDDEEEGGDDAPDTQGGYYDPSAAGRNVADEDGLSDNQVKKSWQLELSHSFDDCIAVDIVLGGYGEALSRGDLWTASSGDILAICVALRRVHGVSEDELELSVHEVVYDLSVRSTHKVPHRRHSSHAADRSNIDHSEEDESNAPCRYNLVHVGTIPWLGPTPYALQAWRTGSLSFSVSASSQGGVITMCTVECLRTWDVHRRDAWGMADAGSNDTRPNAIPKPGRSHRLISYNHAALHNSDWAIGDSFCVKLSPESMEWVEKMHLTRNQKNEKRNHGSNSSSNMDSNINVGTVMKAEWIPICCPLLGGRRAIVLGVPGKPLVMVGILRTTNGKPSGSHGVDGDSMGIISGVPVSRRVALTNAVKCAAVVECVQVIDVLASVKWAQWLDGYTFQISTGSEWLLFSRKDNLSTSVNSNESHAFETNDSNIINIGNRDNWSWEMVSSAPFGCTDRPNTMSADSVEQQNTMITGSVLATANSSRRGMLPMSSPDWNPLEIAFRIFEHPIITEFGEELSKFRGLNSALHRISALAHYLETPPGACIDTMVSSLLPERFPKLCKLSENIGLDISVPKCNRDMLQDLLNSIFNTARGIALAHDRKNSRLNNLAINMLPLPLRTLSPVEVLIMYAHTASLAELYDEAGEVGNKIDRSNDDNAHEAEDTSVMASVSKRVSNLDQWARNAITVHKCSCALESLNNKPNMVDSSDSRPTISALGTPPVSNNMSERSVNSGDSSSEIRVSGAFVANALSSSSQKELYGELIGDVTDKICRELSEGISSKVNAKLHFGMLWWARNSAGRDSDVGEIDILNSLSAILTPLWLHDFTPLLSLIESVATQQFKHHRDSMKVFLELVLAGKTEKLLLLSKTDKNVMGKQLQSLLRIDFASEKGRNSLHKNAFALLRLQRYKHAVAVFLCAEPPMLREAVRVVVKYLNNPFLALLIARLVEHRRALLYSSSDKESAPTFLGHPEGCVLGPVSRDLLESELIPGLSVVAKQRKSDNLPREVVQKSWCLSGGDAIVLLGVCGQWLQDASVYSKLACIGRSCGYFTPATDCSDVGKAKQLINMVSSVKWLVVKADKFNQEDSVRDIIFELDAIFDGLNVSSLRLFCRKMFDEHRSRNRMDTDTVERDEFMSYSMKCVKDWELNKSSRIAALKDRKAKELEVKRRELAQKEIKSVTFDGCASNSNDVELNEAMNKLNRLNMTNKVDNSIPVKALPKKGFNFAAASASSSQNSTKNMLEGYDSPVPKAKMDVSAPSALDMFDMPSQPAKAQPRAAPASMLDGFDAPPAAQVTKSKASEPPSALDMFDMPPQPAKAQPRAAPASMLDGFDAPPAAQVTKSKASEPPNGNYSSMLDGFDVGPGLTVKDNIVEDDDDIKAIVNERVNGKVKIFNEPFAVKKHSDELLADMPSDSKEYSSHLQSGLCETLVHITSEYLMESRCISELVKVIGCPTMGHPWAVAGNVRGLVDIVLKTCSKGQGDENIRLHAFRCCLNELSRKYAPVLMTDIRIAKSMVSQTGHYSAGGSDRANYLKPELRYILCARLLEFLELRKSLDCCAVRVLLCWAAGRAEEARRILLVCAVAIFEATPQCADFSDLCDAPVLRLSRQCFMLCMASNLEMLLTINVGPASAEKFIPSCRMSHGLIVVIATAIRAAMCFGCVDHRYDILLKILKHPPKFYQHNSDEVRAEHSTPQVDSTVESKPRAHSKPRDHGYHYLKRVSRAEAITLLQGHTPGTFLVRPHDTQSEVLFLSFLSSAEEGVKHAIIRREVYISRTSDNDDGIMEEPISGRKHHQYRCGKIGPCKTLEETLQSISLILPCRLQFKENVAEIVAGEGLSSIEKESNFKQDHDNHHCHRSKTNHHRDGGFVSKVDQSCENVKFTPAMSLLDFSWNPNAEFWWECVHHKKVTTVDEDSTKPEQTRQSMLAIQYAEYLSPNQIDDYAGHDAPATHIAERDSYQNVVITRNHDRMKSNSADDESDSTAEDDHGSEKQPHKVEASITVELNRREQRRGNEDRGWGSPLSHNNIGGIIRGVIQLLTVKTLYKQLCSQLVMARRTMASSDVDSQLESELRILILLKLCNRLPVSMLPRDGEEQPHIGSTDSSDPHFSPNLGIDNSKHSTMHATDGLPLSAIDYLLFPLALYSCVSERAMMSVLCPPLPLDPASLTSPKMIVGEQLAQSLLSETDGVHMNLVKIPHSSLASHLGFVVSHTTNSVSHSAPAIQDQVVECFDLADSEKWVNNHADNDALNTILCYLSSTDIENNSPLDTIPDGSATIKWLWKKGFLQNIVIGSGTSGNQSNSQIFYRYVDPWEVSVVTDQTAVLSSCRLGRLWLGPVSAYGASGLIEVIKTYLREAHNREADILQLPNHGTGHMNSSVISSALSQDSADTQSSSLLNHFGDSGFVKLWETLRAEAWLVMCISSATDQPERETGGPDAFVEANITGLSSHDPYHLCITRYLYRNALFKRDMLPHRFVAMIQVDTFVLKDLAPHKFKAGVVSAPIEVYGVLRLIRSGGGEGVKKSDALKKGSCDIVVTSSRRAETAKTASTSQPSEYLWREQAVLRFPLPESILSVDPFSDDNCRYLRQPPRKLQLSVYESRSLFGDNKLGDLELPLSALTDEKPLREWLPLTSEKGSAWFIRIQLQLRFLLMAHDADRATDPESSTIR